jgi:Holliday junction resolvasome RuvABC endonuclease subunit
MVVQLLGLMGPPEPADVSDALALAIAFAKIDAQRARFADAGLPPIVARARRRRVAG